MTAGDAMDPGQLAVSRSGAHAIPEEIVAANANDKRVMLLSGGCVITMDPSIGDFARADVLIEGDEIRAIGTDLSTASLGSDVTIIDASDTIIAPGFVDTHRHMWQGQLRRMIPNVDIADYLGLRNAFAVEYRPEDSYAGTYLNALGALNAGVTSVQDLSHNTRSSGHADAGVDALEDSGIRAVFAYAPPEAGEWDNQWPNDLERIKSERVDGNALLSLRMAQRCFSDADNLTQERISIARDLAIGMTVDPVAWAESSEKILALAEVGALGPDLAFVHCSDLSDEAWAAMGAADVKVSLSPFVDEILGFDPHPERLPTVQRALDVGIKPGLSVDIETTVPGDMFTQMRALLSVQRMRAALGNPAVGRPQLTAREVLAFATIHGAETVGLSETCGSLTPGKKADIIVIDQSGPESFPLNNAYGAVVLGADTGALKSVMVAGRIKKWGHTLVDNDPVRARSLIEDSRDYLLSRLDYAVDLFIDYPTLDMGPRQYRP